MKKSLVVVAVLVACAFGLTGAALATEVETGGDIQFKISGTSQDGKASELFGKGDVRIDYKVSLTSGPFEISLMPRFDLPDTLTWEEAYIKRSFSPLSIALHPLGIDLELWDIGGIAATGNKPNIPKNAGIKVEIPVQAFTFGLLVNNQAGSNVFDADGILAGSDPFDFGWPVLEEADKSKFSYGAEVKYEIDAVTLEALYGFTDVQYVKSATSWTGIEWVDGLEMVTITSFNPYDWYGSYMGAKTTLDLAPLALEAQFGSFSPEATGLKDGSGYFAKVEYALDEELGTLTLEYTGVDKNLNGKGTPTAKAYSKIKGEYGAPLAEAVKLVLGVASIEPGTGVKSFTEYEVSVKVVL